jgi:hypothetical protein
MDANHGKALAYLLSVLVTMLKDGDIEQRLKQLEEQWRTQSKPGLNGSKPLAPGNTFTSSAGILTNQTRRHSGDTRMPTESDRKT